VELFLVEIDIVVVDFTFIREGRVEFKDLVLDRVAEFDPRVVLDRVIEVGPCRPDKRKYQDHRAAGVCVEVGHLVQVLFGTELVEEDVEYVYAALNQVVVHCRYYLFAFFSQPDQVFLEQALHLIDHVDDVWRNCSVFLPIFLECDRPCLDYRLPPQMHRLKVHHPASGNCGRGSHCQVVDFEHHRECSWQFDTLPVGQTQHLVVVQHSIEVFNPKGVYWSVELDPLFHVRTVRYIRPDDGSHNTVSPLVGEDVCVAKQLVHGDRLGVETFSLDYFMIVISGPLLIKLFHSS
jgi:hypothetical protein